MIYESNLISSTDTDLLAAGRLNSIPYNGRLTLDFLSDFAEAANKATISIKLPNGDIPVDGQLIPGNPDKVDGVLDERQLMRFTFPAGPGGHFTVSVTITGSAVVMYRAVLTP